MILFQSLARQVLPSPLAVGFPSAWLLPQSAKCASQAASGYLALLPLKCPHCSKPDWQGERYRWGKSCALLSVLAKQCLLSLSRQTHMVRVFMQVLLWMHCLLSGAVKSLFLRDVENEAMVNG